MTKPTASSSDRTDGFADEARVARHLPSTRLRRLITPRQLRGYPKQWLRGDMLAGLTISALVLPLGLAFAELAGLPAVYGLYTSILPVVVFAILASTPQAVVGAEAVLAGIIAVAASPVIARGFEATQVVANLSIMVGVICILGALLRLGRAAQLVSRPVFSGYLSGVAVAITATQIPKLLGASPYEHSSLLGQASELGRVLGDVNAPGAVIGVATVVAMLVGRRLAPGVPVALGAIVLASIASAAFHLDRHGVMMVGALPRQLPDVLPSPLPIAEMMTLVPAAAVIALIAFVDTTVVTQGFAARNRYRVDSTRDLAALGAADVASGLFAGMPLSASTARTAVADASGAHSQVATAASGAAILVILLAFADAMKYVPQPALAGVVAAVMIGVADLPTLRRLAASRRMELLVALTAFAGVALFGIVEGVLVAVGISILAFVLRALQPHDAVLAHIGTERAWHAIDEATDARGTPGLLVYRFDAPLFFANVDFFRGRLLALCDERDVRHVIVEAAAITDIDYTASRVLEDLLPALHDRRITLAFAEVNHELVALLRRDGLYDRLGERAFFRTLGEAEAAWIRSETATST